MSRLNTGAPKSLMSLPLLVLVVLAAFASGFLIAVSLSVEGRSISEALQELLLPLVETPHTRFAQSLQESNFWTLPYGATEGDVLGLIGAPLKKRACPESTSCWDYSLGAFPDASHHVRVLVFSPEGRLIKRHSGFVVGD